MKKISAFFLALALCLGLAVPAFAADGGAYPTFKAPENSGTIFQAQTMAIKLVGFAGLAATTPISPMEPFRTMGIAVL